MQSVAPTNVAAVVDLGHDAVGPVRRVGGDRQAGPLGRRITPREVGQHAFGASCPVAPRRRKGPLTEPTTAAQPWPRERVLIPHTGHWPGLVGALRAEKNGHSLWMRMLFDDLVGAGE